MFTIGTPTAIEWKRKMEETLEMGYKLFNDL
jgi:hypothetical protein